MAVFLLSRLAVIRDQVERDRRERQAEAQKLSDKKLSDTPKPEHAEKTATKAAELFNTNRTYVNQANAVNQHSEPMRQKIDTQPDRNEARTQAKAAELFNTNRTYVNQAVKMKTAAPEVFEKGKASGRQEVD